MPYQQTIFINLPVHSLPTSLAFYTSLGFVQNKSFSNDSAAMISLPMTSTAGSFEAHSSPIKFMLLAHEFYSTFLPASHKKIVGKGGEGEGGSEVLLCMSRESKEAVDQFMEKVAKALGKEGESVDVMPKQEHDWGMYGRAFADPDGHIWELTYMPPEQYEGKE